ncbi:hypothetical protein ACM46_04585 [Chryseobacterium angstadtii]|uniref:DUF5105 domain-containing protein n=1 Tax=Chryseobacterium angstadtii TaxID=558151 RepID=A0A0J7LD01_9FLAO|nr:hypothetical protein [Chryseobacterium angstadtii]KMQ66785.1 hypothetical protein ACM46_04585 [Chryseobacterium angstadtii]
MKNFKIIFLVILAIFGQNLSAQTEVKKPSEVFEMYFGTFVNNNSAVLDKLNDYLRPTVEGETAYQVDFNVVSKDMMKESTDNFLSVFPKATADACRKEAEEYFTAMMENFKNGKLTVKEVKVVQNEHIEDQKIAHITYSVSFKVPAKFSDIPPGDIKNVKPEELKKYLVQSVKDFKAADKTVVTEQKFSLYQLNEGGKIYYWNGSPDEIVSGLTDFYFESFGSK